MVKIYNKQQQKNLRRRLRQRPIKSERLLWQKIRNRKLGNFKFRRQYGVGNYVLDFYCPELKLAIELDGATHSSKEERDYDKKRQSFIESFGIRVIRFNNSDVFKNMDLVLDRIFFVCKELENAKA